MKVLKIGGVILGALIITALGIDATDSLTGVSGSMLGNIIDSTESVCPAGMTEVSGALTFTCVDIYEASAAASCPVSDPQQQRSSQDNLNNLDCHSESQSASIPWRFVSRDQAMIACARAGKRLPTSAEWYQAALGTVDETQKCNIDGGSVVKTGIHEQCLSAAGVYDMIGNVWEWVADDVIDGVYSGRPLPEDGYVTQVDASGVATVSDQVSSENYNDDYIWVAEQGHFGVLRGGYYGSETDGGIYAFHAKTAPTVAGNAIGFRCVR